MALSNPICVSKSVSESTSPFIYYAGCYYECVNHPTFRIWHVANPPRRPFHFDVPDPDHAVTVLDALAYCDYQEESKNPRPAQDPETRALVRQVLAAYRTYGVQEGYYGQPVDMNAQGLEVQDSDGTWVEWRHNGLDQDIAWFIQQMDDHGYRSIQEVVANQMSTMTL